jgi:hypothetical protein
MGTAAMATLISIDEYILPSLDCIVNGFERKIQDLYDCTILVFKIMHIEQFLSMDT